MASSTASSGNRRGLIIGAIIAAVVLLALIIVGTIGQPAAPPATAPTAPAEGSGAAETQPEQSPPALPDLSRRIEGDPTAMGAVDAPVVMIEYADYRCPFCSVFARDTLPALVEEYVADGRLRVEWRDLPLFGEDSVAAAVAARAAGEQGRFWEYHHVVAEAAPNSGHPDLPREKLIEFATAAGVPDVAAFTTALDSPELLAQVQADQAEAQSLGVPSTPTFLIGGGAVVGAQPIENFRTAIDTALAEAGR